LIHATLFRALVLSAALAVAMTPVRCFGEDGQLPEKATRELSSELLSLFHQKKMPKSSPIILRIFKEEAELEVWKQDTTGHFQLLKIYPICRRSGDLGPKIYEGDRQTPEGFYTITLPRRLLVERLLCHDRRADRRDLLTGARLATRTTVIPGPGLSVPHDTCKLGPASNQSALGLLEDAQDWESGHIAAAQNDA
jgi:hypothetical protein